MNQPLSPESLPEALAASGAVRENGPYPVEIGDESLTYRQVVIDDPVPTGRHVLEAAGRFGWKGWRFSPRPFSSGCTSMRGSGFRRAPYRALQARTRLRLSLRQQTI